VRRFIIGLPLFQKNAVEMSRQMTGQAKKYLGSSVMGYELGNEVRRLHHTALTPRVADRAVTSCVHTCLSLDQSISSKWTDELMHPCVPVPLPAA
jgi:hypothetical protein